jgi:hypothetical protein
VRFERPMPGSWSLPLLIGAPGSSLCLHGIATASPRDRECMVSNEQRRSGWERACEAVGAPFGRGAAPTATHRALRPPNRKVGGTRQVRRVECGRRAAQTPPCGSNAGQASLHPLRDPGALELRDSGQDMHLELPGRRGGIDAFRQCQYPRAGIRQVCSPARHRPRWPRGTRQAIQPLVMERRTIRSPWSSVAAGG